MYPKPHVPTAPGDLDFQRLAGGEGQRGARLGPTAGTKRRAHSARGPERDSGGTSSEEPRMCRWRPAAGATSVTTSLAPRAVYTPTPARRKKKGFVALTSDEHVATHEGLVPLFVGTIGAAKKALQNDWPKPLVESQAVGLRRWLSPFPTQAVQQLRGDSSLLIQKQPLEWVQKDGPHRAASAPLLCIWPQVPTPSWAVTPFGQGVRGNGPRAGGATVACTERQRVPKSDKFTV